MNNRSVTPETIRQEYVDAKELALKLGLSIKSIQKFTAKNSLPGIVRIGKRCVRYHLPVIERRLLTGNLLLK